MTERLRLLLRSGLAPGYRIAADAKITFRGRTYQLGVPDDERDLETQLNSSLVAALPPVPVAISCSVDP